MILYSDYCTFNIFPIALSTIILTIKRPEQSILNRKKMNKKDTISEFNNIFSKEVTKLLSKEALLEANRFNDDDEHRHNQENTIYGKAIEELRILKTLFNNLEEQEKI